MKAVLSIILAALQPPPLAAEQPALPAAAVDMLRCAAAATIAPEAADADEQEQLESRVAATFFVLSAASVSTDSGQSLARVPDYYKYVLSYQPTAEQATPLAASCRKRYPLSSSTKLPKLPVDPFKRDVMCFFVASGMTGVAKAMDQDFGTTKYADRYNAIIERFAARLTEPVLKQHGANTEAAVQRLAGEQLIASLALGNFASIANSCAAQPR